MPDFNRLKKEVEEGTAQVRRTNTKLSITGEYDRGAAERVSFRKKRDGIELKWSGHVSVATEETQECELGHKHQVSVKKHFVWNYCTLTDGDRKALIEFLSE